MTPTVLREAEIRPDHLRQGQAERLLADVRQLLRRRHEFVPVDCPACGGTTASTAFQKYELTYRKCAQCGTMYVSPRPTPAILERFYAESQNYAFWNQHVFPASEEVRRERIFRPRAERLAELCRGNGIEGGTLLEVGAGFGTFCEEVGQLALFQRVIAVEPTPPLAETCRRKGLEVIQRPVEQLGDEVGEVTVVAAFEVIEHLFSPRDFVMACRERLAPGGILVITCPNVRGFDVAVLGACSDTVDAEHLNYFHPGSLPLLLSRCGLVPVEVQTPGELDAELVRKKVLAGEFDLAGQPFLRQLLLEEWTRIGGALQRFLAENLLSSHMWVIARKPPY